MTFKTRSGHEVVIDDEDHEILSEWSFCSVNRQRDESGMVCYEYPILFSAKVEGKRESKYLARAIMGVDDPNMEVLHRDGNGRDCRKANLVIRKKTWRRPGERTVLA